MNSHDLAVSLRNIANKLEAKEPFECPDQPSVTLYYWAKQPFVAAARAVGGQKVITEYRYGIITNVGGVDFQICAPRDTVCRLISPARPAEYECDPLLTPAEEAGIPNV